MDLSFVHAAVLELLLVTDKGRRVAERIAPSEETLHAPHLADSEVLGAPLLTSHARLGEVPDASVHVEVL